MPSTRLASSSVPPEIPRAFARRSDGFRHASAGGLWLAPLVYLEHARFGPGWYGKVVSSDPERLLAWAVSKAIFGEGNSAGVRWVQAPLLAHGYQVGSGLAESACKRFGTDRMKGAGMRWTVPGAQQVATLRMLLLSDRWQEVADRCRRPA